MLNTGLNELNTEVCFTQTDGTLKHNHIKFLPSFEPSEKK